MTSNPVFITSTTNPHAVFNYLGFVAIGWMGSHGDGAKALDDTLGPGMGAILLMVLTIAGVAALLSSLFVSKTTDPSVGLSVEIGTLLPIVISLGILLGSVATQYGWHTAPITLSLVASAGLGSLGRLIQASYERYQLHRAKKEAAKLTTDVQVTDKD